MEFQVVTWDSKDVQTDNGLVFNINLFGRRKDGQSVFCKTEFTPYFFIEVPSHWSKTNNMKLQDLIVTNFPKYLQRDKEQILDMTLVRRKKFSDSRTTNCLHSCVSSSRVKERSARRFII